MGWWWADPASAFVIVYFLIKEAREAWKGEDTCCDHR
jgi:divalent metal cation (Fe/Co/Zn/Cd) transporter